MTDFSRFSDANIEALSNVAFGGDGRRIPFGRLRALERRGLIAHEMQVVGSDRFGEISVPVWFMPTPVHIAFCSWGAEQVPGEEER